MKTFQTKSQVVEFLTSLENEGFLSSHSAGWSQAGTYYLRHGEYSQPDYRPTRYKDGWGIAKVPFYNAGTFNAPSRSRVDLVVTIFDYDPDGNPIKGIEETFE